STPEHCLGNFRTLLAESVRREHRLQFVIRAIVESHREVQRESCPSNSEERRKFPLCLLTSQMSRAAACRIYALGLLAELLFELPIELAASMAVKSSQVIITRPAAC